MSDGPVPGPPPVPLRRLRARRGRARRRLHLQRARRNANSNQVAGGGGDNAQPGKEVTIGFSAPAADHGWIAAITKNAQAQAEAFKDVKFNATEGTNDVNQQIAQVESLVNDEVDVLVILPLRRQGADRHRAGGHGRRTSR